MWLFSELSLLSGVTVGAYRYFADIPAQKSLAWPLFFAADSRNIGFETKLLFNQSLLLRSLREEGGKGGGGQAEVKSLEEGLKRPTLPIYHSARVLQLPERSHSSSSFSTSKKRAERWGRGSGERREKSRRLFLLLCIDFACLASPRLALRPGGLEHTTTLSERPWPGRSPIPHLQTLDRGRLEEVEREGEEEEEEEEEADAEGVARELRLKVCTVRFCSSRGSFARLSPSLFLSLSLSLHLAPISLPAFEPEVCPTTNAMPRKSIVEVKVLDVQKRRIPNKHYVSQGDSVVVVVGGGWWAGCRIWPVPGFQMQKRALGALRQGFFSPYGQWGGWERDGERLNWPRACPMAILTEDDGIAVQRIWKGTSLEQRPAQGSPSPPFCNFCVVPFLSGPDFSSVNVVIGAFRLCLCCNFLTSQAGSSYCCLVCVQRLFVLAENPATWGLSLLKRKQWLFSCQICLRTPCFGFHRESRMPALEVSFRQDAEDDRSCLFPGRCLQLIGCCSVSSGEKQNASAE
ncbi:SH3 and PX domain-containing protein 2B, partial [Ophiophagus hannah]